MENKELSEAIFAGGCFWCTEAVFKRLKGVEKVESGYTGGNIRNPAYREVCTGRTGHAEGVRITYNAGLISYDELLEVFFATHDPTTLNRQGNDVGTQYRSAVFYKDEEQKEKAVNYIRSLEKEKIYDSPVVTEVTEAGPFYVAEADHQDYYERNTSQPYCQVIITPKLRKLKHLYKDKLETE
ncbi:peptide-methionine (S)-S-oxide reductase [Sinomicrobium pectinilyticum]|uniref:Peptide methionine sulfoxide reductase MsrA n=1 Tax=Sinomicrobium pectinilyticum TaxID=1084421 RepID=A0A3N0DYY7_SINP1|nr:peptide-methionine (S)-S-oxide reductase MsrA [Sinomicrobium pectinilyticum]RNL80693.1 peptide-methionine (S)-S-oxide reductase [Sinomicrobium pectinilyticum]